MIRVENLVKDYGAIKAVDNISFEVGDRQILGFLGPNGAGKSTVMKIITTYLAPTDGRVTVDGIDVSADPIAVRRKIGYLPETNPLYSDMRVEDYLRFCGEARGIASSALPSRLRWVVDACSLGRVMKQNIHELSKGYKQRTGLAQALIHDPEILILDEPTSGLDPLQIIEIRSMIQELAKEKTIVFSTHILQEVTATTDRVIIINRGSIIANGYISDLKQEISGRNHVRVCAVADRSSIESQLGSLAGVSQSNVLSESNGAVTVDVYGKEGADLQRQIGELASTHQWTLLELSSPTASLEDAFIELIRRNSGGKVAHA